jgi:hypothetical protein
MNTQPKITLSLDMNELNTIMAGLGKLPYEQCFAVVDSIRAQVSPQLQEQQAAGGQGAMGPGRE